MPLTNYTCTLAYLSEHTNIPIHNMLAFTSYTIVYRRCTLYIILTYIENLT